MFCHVISVHSVLEYAYYRKYSTDPVQPYLEYAYYRKYSTDPVQPYAPNTVMCPVLVSTTSVLG